MRFVAAVPGPTLWEHLNALGLGIVGDLAVLIAVVAAIVLIKRGRAQSARRAEDTKRPLDLR